MPLQDVASKYEELRQELPPESAQLARECQAFQRARVLESREDLLYLVLLYSIGDLSLREIAGVCAGSGKPLTDEAVRQRLGACPQWVESLLGKLLPTSSLPARAEGPWQLVLCDGSQISGPGAQGTDYRWHVAYDPVAQQIRELHVSAVHTGESLTRYQLGPGLVVTGQTLARMHGAHVQFPDLLGDRVIGPVPAIIRALRAGPADLRAITEDPLPGTRGPSGQRAGRQHFAQEALHPLRTGPQALPHGLIRKRLATARTDAGNLAQRQSPNAVEQHQVQEVLGRLQHPGALEGLTRPRQLCALGRQLLSQLFILASNVLKWHGSLLSRVVALSERLFATSFNTLQPMLAHMGHCPTRLSFAFQSPIPSSLSIWF